MSNISVEAEKVRFTKTSATHACCELSDLTRGGRPDTITITKRDRTWLFKHVGTKRNNDGDAEEFSYRCTAPGGRVFSLTVFND